MVSTRKHPKEFPEPYAATPTSAVSSRASSVRAKSPSSPSDSTSGSLIRRAVSSVSSPTSAVAMVNPGHWYHAPSLATLVWLAISVPIVIWDVAFIFLRPHSFTGQKYGWIWPGYHWQIEIDYVYGWKAFKAGNPWPATQSFMNAIEVAGYMAYAWLLMHYGQEKPLKGRGAARRAAEENIWEKALRGRVITGYMGGIAVLLGFSVSLATFYKTVIYFVMEAFAGYANVSHNNIAVLAFWIAANGAWIVVPTWVMYEFGSEILHGLAIASGDKKRS